MGDSRKTTVYRIRWARLARLGLAFFLENAGQTANSGANFLQYADSTGVTPHMRQT